MKNDIPWSEWVEALVEEGFITVEDESVWANLDVWVKLEPGEIREKFDSVREFREWMKELRRDARKRSVLDMIPPEDIKEFVRELQAESAAAENLPNVLIEPWPKWEKILKEEGFYYSAKHNDWRHDGLQMAVTAEICAREFKTIAAFREHVRKYRSDPQQRKFVRELGNQIMLMTKPPKSE